MTEAYELVWDEPDIFYKLLAKKNTRLVGDTYNTPCDLLFVRTEHKQIYKTVHTVRMFVEGDYHDQIIANLQGAWRERPTGWSADVRDEGRDGNAP